MDLLKGIVSDRGARTTAIDALDDKVVEAFVRQLRAPVEKAKTAKHAAWDEIKEAHAASGAAGKPDWVAFNADWKVKHPTPTKKEPSICGMAVSRYYIKCRAHDEKRLWSKLSQAEKDEWVEKHKKAVADALQVKVV